MTPTQKRIYEAIQKEPGISAATLQANLKFATTQALQAHLRSMFKANLIKPTPAKSAGWVCEMEKK